MCTHMESPDEEWLLREDLLEQPLSLGEVPLELVQQRLHEPPLHLAGLGLPELRRVPQRAAPVLAPHPGEQQALERGHVARVFDQDLQVHLDLDVLLFLFLLVARLHPGRLHLFLLFLEPLRLVLLRFFLLLFSGFLLLLSLPLGLLRLLRRWGRGGEGREGAPNAGEGEEGGDEQEEESSRGGRD